MRPRHCSSADDNGNAEPAGSRVGPGLDGACPRHEDSCCILNNSRGGPMIHLNSVRGRNSKPGRPSYTGRGIHSGASRGACAARRQSGVDVLQPDGRERGGGERRRVNGRGLRRHFRGLTEARRSAGHRRWTCWGWAVSPAASSPARRPPPDPPVVARFRPFSPRLAGGSRPSTQSAGVMSLGGLT